MAGTNPFFNSVYPGQTTEQNLVDSLVIEQIEIFWGRTSCTCLAQ